MAASLQKKYFHNKIESLHSLDPHTWWTKIKNFLQFPDSNPIQSLHYSQSDAGLPITELINNFFVGISAGLPELDSNMLSDLGHDYNSDFVIDPSEVDIRLSKIKIHKAPGPDGIPNWLLRDFSQLLYHPLAAIFSASIREGFFCKVTFDLLTLKVVSELRLSWSTSVPVLVFLGLSVLDLGPMYVTDRQTDVRQMSDVHHRLMPPPYGGGA